MKKIAILNFQYSTHNYGAVLQAAALEHVFRGLGHDPQHMDFMAKQKISLEGRARQLLRKMGLRRAPKANRVVNEEAFECFRQRFINRTKRFTSAKEFRRVAKTFDFVVVGSDQVWRPAYAKDTIAFFLGYVPKGIGRIAYAASFGTATWEQAGDLVLTSRVRNELRQFKAISCREESGVSICKDIFGVEATHVIDPLLLVNDGFLDEIIALSSIRKNAKLVYYKLDASDEFQEDMDVIGAELGAAAVNIYLKDSNVREYREVSEWLALIAEANVVVTDSFHCICLALRLGKEVIYCPNDKRGQTRLDSLFKKLNIGVEPLDLKLKTPMFKLARQDDLRVIFEAERAKALKFLADALDD